MLRQNLFERFASSSTVPSEAPVVPVSISRHAHQGSESSRSTCYTIPQNLPLILCSLQLHRGRPDAHSISSFPSVCVVLLPAVQQQDPDAGRVYGFGRLGKRRFVVLKDIQHLPGPQEEDKQLLPCVGSNGGLAESRHHFLSIAQDVCGPSTFFCALCCLQSQTIRDTSFIFPRSTCACCRPNVLYTG